MFYQTKNIFLVTALVFISFCSNAQTLFTYGNSSTSSAEFFRAYNKNKTNVTDKEKSVREYLDYIPILS